MRTYLSIILSVLLFPVVVCGQAGNTMATPIVAGTYSNDFDYTDLKNTSNFTDNYAARPTNDVYYKFTLNVMMEVTIYHCDSYPYLNLTNTYISLLDVSGNLIAYNEHGAGPEPCGEPQQCFIKKDLDPGTYYVVTEGYDENGLIKTYISGESKFKLDINSLSSMLPIGTFSVSAKYSNTQSTVNGISQHPGRPSNDIFYKFAITKRMNATITHCGSAIDDTYMYLLDASGITYGPDRQRWKSILKKDGTTTRSIVYAGDYEKITEGGVTKEFFYISGNDGLIAIHVKGPGQTNKTYCVYKDHLGSIVKLADISGNEVFKASYDAWGKRTVTNNTFRFHRGYTGHEHLDEFRLIDMNGRMYDPLLARFLSPDPFVQMPDFSQNFNRYSYCVNNPLIYKDPSGEFIHLIIGAIIGGVTNWALNGADFSWKGFGYFGVGALAGTLGAGVSGGISSALPVAGTASGGFVAGFLGTSAATTATSSFLSGALIGGGAGLASGFTSGLGNSLLDGQNFGQALGKGGINGTIGMSTSALVSGIFGGLDAVTNGREFWNGAKMIDEQSLANQNLLLVQQRGNMNCGPATGESITGVSQDRYRAIIGGDPNTDPVTIQQLNDAIQIETGRKAEAFINTLPTDKAGAEQMARIMNRGNNFYLGSTTPGQPIGHATALNSVTVRTFQKISGRLYYKVIYQVMDPAQGAYKIIGAKSMKVVVRIHP